MREIPCGAQICSFLSIDNRIDHLDIYTFIDYFFVGFKPSLRSLWLFYHTDYRNLVNPQGPCYISKTVFINLSKTSQKINMKTENSFESS